MDSAPKSNQQFCLRWHNHQASLLTSLPILLNQSSLTDVTLSAEGKTLQAHRVVLSACSNFFAELFRNLEQSYHPVICLPGAKFPAVVALVSFMYSGETNVFEEQIPGLLILAESLGIKGLADLKHNNIQSVNKILKINEDKVQTYQFESKANEDNRNSASNNVFPKKCIYSNLVPEDELKISSNLLSNCEQYYNYLSRHQENRRLSQETAAGTVAAATTANPSEILQDEGKILSNLNNFNQITEILRCLSSSSIAVSNFANELSIMKSSSDRPGNTAVDKKSEDDINYYDDTISVEGNSTITNNFPGIIKSSQVTNNNDLVRNKNIAAAIVEPVKPPSSTSSKLYATCFICQKQLSNQYNLRVHLETHQNVRYSCNVCPHVSRSKDALRKHVSYRHSNNVNCYEIEPRKKRAKLIGIPSDGTIPTSSFVESETKLDFHNDEIKDEIIKNQGNFSTSKTDLSSSCQISSPMIVETTQVLEKSSSSLPTKLNLGNLKNNLIKTIDKPINDIQSESI